MQKFFFLIVSFHDESSHPGRTATEKTIQQLYYWRGMRNDISQYIAECEYCGIQKAFTRPPPIIPIVSKKKRERAIFDLTDLGEDAQGYRYILVVVDTFTKFAWTFALESKLTGPITERYCKKKFVNNLKDSFT